MTTSVVKVARNADGYLETLVSKRNAAVVSSSANDITDELWSSLEYYSESKDVGHALLLSLGCDKRNVTKTYAAFRANVRQARKYFDAARVTHYSAASLLYYYSFLNLVKAGLVARNPALVGTKLNHGLSYNVTSNRKLKAETVAITGRPVQVFSTWYKEYFGTAISAKYLNVSILLGYVSDIGVQYSMCNFGESKLMPGVFKPMINKTTQEAWGLVGIRSAGRFENFPKSTKSFYDKFEEVDVSNSLALELFKMNGYGKSQFVFYQSRVPTPFFAPDVPPSPRALADELVGALGGMFQTNYYPGEVGFFASEPYRKNKQVVLDETFAIYLVMFYLSSLVRYRPEYLETLLDSREAWLIENFVKFSPITFLRSTISWLINYDYMYSRR